MVARTVRYGLASVGPVGSAGAQFVLSVQLLHVLDPGAFGAFSFLLVASQFSLGLWSALFCAPMPILLSGDEARDGPMRRCLMSTNLWLAIFAFAVFAVLGVLLHADPAASLLFAAYAMAMLLRWFARAYAYATGRPWRTMTSDIIYTIVLLAGVGLVAVTHASSAAPAYASLLTGAALSLAPFGPRYLKQQFGEVSLKASAAYARVWREHSGWSLTGVLTTEATANAHAYIVTLISGATAFAPLAASALLMRPISVVTNALTEFERPQMARQLAQDHGREALATMRFFRIMLIVAWTATVVAALALMRYGPGLLFPTRYDRSYLMIGTLLWLAIAGVRTVRTAESVLLQAAGQFRPLAHASMISCGVSLIGVLALLLLGGPLYSLVGVLLGEAVFALWIWRETARWRSGTEQTVAPAELPS
ncbi:hypothetical protein [Caulobacter sp. UNC279MFTsu5.1]|uniref:hypothetical protein n=1 Tax=Caulobacter sp. UNC279MFTsu5.1 TaxID=1502775 RepID=UPI0008EFEF46|nr:hypothetical protein [Caulobacter sp. UNC279MFTsu5.1]SFJ40322.1 Membrane protein involved in the export of O-antigen and teichoic acid [Caulobacter sp. UNC279MFTsu5.1]